MYKIKKFFIILEILSKKKKIKIVFPFSEHEAEILSLEKEYYKKKGVKVIISDYKVLEYAEIKSRQISFLIKLKLQRLIDFEKLEYLPIIIKKDLVAANINLL